jgi:hypothetical protein
MKNKILENLKLLISDLKSSKKDNPLPPKKDDIDCFSVGEDLYGQIQTINQYIKK